MLSSFGERSNDSRSWENVRVDYGCPPHDRERAGGVLKLNSVCAKEKESLVPCSVWLWYYSSRHTANVAKFAILKDDKLFAAGELIEASNGLFVEIGDDVGMGLENANVVANILGQAQQFVCCSDVGGNTQVCALEVHETQEVGGQRGQTGIF